MLSGSPSAGAGITVREKRYGPSSPSGAAASGFPPEHAGRPPGAYVPLRQPCHPLPGELGSRRGRLHGDVDVVDRPARFATEHDRVIVRAREVLVDLIDQTGVLARHAGRVDVRNRSHASRE